METIKSISIVSKKNIGSGQIIADRYTPTEKKILIKMLNLGLEYGQVRNKIFTILKTGENTAKVNIITITNSIITGKKEIVNHKAEIKYK